MWRHNVFDDDIDAAAGSAGCGFPAEPGGVMIEYDLGARRACSPSLSGPDVANKSR
jgi:hypothetical protein